MPIKLEEKEAGKVLEVQASGKLTHGEYAEFLPRLEELIKRHRKLRVLFEMVDFHGWEGTALWDEIKFDLKHFSDVEKVAMVGDQRWEKLMSALCRPFTTAKVRYFDRGAVNEARQWVLGAA